MSDKETVSRFVGRLEELDVGGRARLRRNAGTSLSEARNAMSLFFRLLPPNVAEYHHETYFMIATLFPLCESMGTGAEAGRTRNLGATLRSARNDNNGSGLDRRMEALLESDPEQLRFRLRQAIRLARSARLTVDWAQLLRDVLLWDHPDKFVQRRWAEAYFGDESHSTQRDASQQAAPV